MMNGYIILICIVILISGIYLISKSDATITGDYLNIALLDEYQLDITNPCPSDYCVYGVEDDGTLLCRTCVNITEQGNTTEQIRIAVNETGLFYNIIVNDTLWDKDYNDLINKPTLLSDFIDDLNNRGYTHLTNFTDNLGNRGYNSLSNFTNNMGYINNTSNRSYVLRTGDDMNGTLIINTTKSQLMGLLGEAPSDWTNVPLVLQAQNGRDLIQIYNSTGSNIGYIDSTGVAYLQGLNLGLVATKNYVSMAGGLKLSNYWMPRMADMSNIVQYDYQDELAYRHKIANSITISPTSNTSGSINNTFIDDSTTLSYSSGTTINPFSVTINTNSSPITNKASGSWRLGLTFRSSATTAIPTRFTVEADVTGNGTYFLVLNDSVLGYGSIFDTYLSPTFTTPSPFNFYKMRINMTFISNPVIGIFRLQRLMLYHQTSAWDNFHVSKSGDSMYGNLVGGENNTYDLGSPTNMWNDLYLGGVLYGGSPVLFKDDICMWDRGLKTYVECYPENLKIVCEENKECNEKFERSEALNQQQETEANLKKQNEMRIT